MIPVLATTLAVVLGHYLLAGSAVDLGLEAWASAPAVLLLALGWGLMSRAKLPYLADSLALALLVPARGPLCDLVLSLTPWDWGAVHLAAVLSLGPVGFALGRQLATLLEGPVLAPLAGWVAGEALVELGIAGWMPGWLSGFVAAGLLAALVEMGSGRRMHSVGGGDERRGWEAAPLGAALALAFVCLRRVVPSYVTPQDPLGSEVILALAVPALPVVAFAMLLTSSAVWRRALFSLAMLGLAWALWMLTVHLGLHLEAPRLIAMTREFRNISNRGWPLVTEWHLWLTFFTGAVAAMSGVALAGLPRRAVGPLALGLGLGVLAESWVPASPTWGVLELLLASIGLAGAGCLASWGPRWLLLLPLAAAPFVLFPQELRTGFDGVRRVGDLSADGWSRAGPADVSLFSSGSKDINSVEGRRSAHETFTRRQPLLRLDAEGRALFQETVVDGPPRNDVVPDLLADHERDDAPLERWFGVRVAGVAMHPDADPMGPEGSMGRLLRVFARPGATLVLGVGAELAAADLADAGLTRDLVVGTRLPLGPLNTRILLEDSGSGGFDVPVRSGELAALLATPLGSQDTIVLTPDREVWPGAGDQLARSRLTRVAERLSRPGRLLAWVDTSDLDARTLAGRLAAFGDVFGGRCAVFVELRGVDAPLLLAVGWRTDEGRPTAAELMERLPTPDHSGFRTRLADLGDLAAMLVADGSSLAGLGPVHDRSRPLSPAPPRLLGAPAVATLYDPAARLGRAVDGLAEHLATDQRAVLAGLARHAGYFYELYRLRGAMTVETLDDVDWEAFDEEVAHYAEAARQAPDNPLLTLAVAALFEPLIVDQDLSRFAQAFLAVDGQHLPSWRLSLQHAVALKQSLEDAAASEAFERARLQAGLPQ